MKRVLLLGAGAPIANGTVACLDRYRRIGANTNRDDLRFSACEENYLYEPGDEGLVRLIEHTKPDLIFPQADSTVAHVSRMRAAVRQFDCKVFLPRRDVVDTCLDKWLTYEKLFRVNVPVPQSSLPNKMWELKSDRLHTRPRVGGGGRGSFQGGARAVQAFLEDGGRHDYMVAEFLPGPTVTYQGLFDTGKLVASQMRRRLAWTNDDRGSARISETLTSPETQRVAERAIAAIDILPHGVYGVDMTLDYHRKPRVTEINIGRFFTTIDFFAKAGLNFPDLYCRVALGEEYERPGPNPLAAGLQWHRQIDRGPVLVFP